jgi:hypothetical protein
VHEQPRHHTIYVSDTPFSLWAVRGTIYPLEPIILRYIWSRWYISNVVIMNEHLQILYVGRFNETISANKRRVLIQNRLKLQTFHCSHIGYRNRKWFFSCNVCFLINIYLACYHIMFDRTNFRFFYSIPIVEKSFWLADKRIMWSICKYINV